MAAPAAWRHRLDAGLERLQCLLDSNQRARLLAYIALLHKWNQAFNLTAVRDPLSMIDRHLLDSLALLPYLPAGAVLDVGTGAGLPGIPLAIARPQQPFCLLDSNGKKVRFVRQVVQELDLTRVVRPVQARVERACCADLQQAACFDVVISRAYAALPDFLASTAHLLGPAGTWLAMVGRADALPPLPPAADVRAELIPLPDAVEPGDRHLVRLTRIQCTQQGAGSLSWMVSEQTADQAVES